MGINKMKGKFDVSNEDSHVPLYFLVIKYAAQFTSFGRGNQLVYWWGCCGDCAYFSPEIIQEPWVNSPQVGLPPCAGCVLGTQWHSERMSQFLLLVPPLLQVYILPLNCSFSGAASLSLHQTS